MLYYDISGLSFTQIRIFLCAVENESFSAAAKKLNFTQSMISKTIASIEKELGLILFLREKGKTIVTPAGRVLYEEWKNLEHIVEKSIEKAHDAQRGAGITLRVVAPNSGIICTQVVEAVQQFQNTYPSVSLHYTEEQLDQIIALAKRQEADILITTGYEIDTLRKHHYHCQPLFQSKLAIFVHRSNPLFNRERLSFGDLRREKFIVLSPSTNPNYIALLNRMGEENGFQPRISKQVPNAHSFEVNLLTGQGVVLADTHVNIHHPDIKQFIIPPEDAPYYCGTLVAWHPDNPYADHFVQLAIKLGLNQTE